MSAAISRTRLHRPLLAAGVFAMVIAAAMPAAQAQPYDGRGPWCAATLSEGSYDCAFYSYAQCMATASGVTNYCTANPLYVAPPSPLPPRHKRHRRQR
jgi:Protein of unknown function (DUF3551)